MAQLPSVADMKRFLVMAVAPLCFACADQPGNVPSHETRPARYAIGRTPTAEEIAAVDIDANPSGAGLPAGHGTAETGKVTFAQKCSVCHGPKGEGIEKNPKLIGKDGPNGFDFSADFKVAKTIGNYWPYATTLYDYIHRTMPLNAPGSLTPDEVYGLAAFLLSENGIITANYVIDAKSLPAVKMPAQSRFVRDDRQGGTIFR